MEFGRRQGDETFARLRPAVGVFLESLAADPDAAGIEEENLEQIAASIGKDKQVAADWRPTELMRDQGMQAAKPAAEIRDSRRQPDARIASEGEHVAGAWPCSTQHLDQPTQPNRVDARRRDQTDSSRAMKGYTAGRRRGRCGLDPHLGELPASWRGIARLPPMTPPRKCRARQSPVPAKLLGRGAAGGELRQVIRLLFGAPGAPTAHARVRRWGRFRAVLGGRRDGDRRHPATLSASSAGVTTSKLHSYVPCLITRILHRSRHPLCLSRTHASERKISW